MGRRGKVVSDMDLFLLIKKQGGARIGYLADSLGSSNPTIRNHLNRLIELGLVKKDGWYYKDNLKLLADDEFRENVQRIIDIKHLVETGVKEAVSSMDEEMKKVYVRPNLQITEDLFKKLLSGYFHACDDDCDLRLKDDRTACEAFVTLALTYGLEEDIPYACRCYKPPTSKSHSLKAL